MNKLRNVFKKEYAVNREKTTQNLSPVQTVFTVEKKTR